jgi:hypothetical protein
LWQMFSAALEPDQSAFQTFHNGFTFAGTNRFA